MLITDLDHLEDVAQSAPSLMGGRKRNISLSLNQGVLQLSLNGKELFKTALTDLPPELEIALESGNWRKFYRLSTIDGIQTSATTWGFQPYHAISAFASSSISVSPSAV